MSDRSVVFGKVVFMERTISMQGANLRHERIITHVANWDQPQILETIVEDSKMIGQDFVGKIHRYNGKTLVENQVITSLDNQEIQKFQLQWDHFRAMNSNLKLNQRVE